MADGEFKFEVHSSPLSTVQLDGHWNLGKVFLSAYWFYLIIGKYSWINVL